MHHRVGDDGGEGFQDGQRGASRSSEDRHAVPSQVRAQPEAQVRGLPGKRGQDGRRGADRQRGLQVRQEDHGVLQHHAQLPGCRVFPERVRHGGGDVQRRHDRGGAQGEHARVRGGVTRGRDRGGDGVHRLGRARVGLWRRRGGQGGPCGQL